MIISRDPQLGVYYASCGFVCEAVEQWRQLEETPSESRDSRYPGLSCIVNLLLDTNIQVAISHAYLHISPSYWSLSHWLTATSSSYCFRVFRSCFITSQFTATISQSDFESEWVRTCWYDVTLQAVIMSNIEWLISRDPDRTLHLLMKTSAELNNDHILNLLADRPLHCVAFLEHLVVSTLLQYS